MRAPNQRLKWNAFTCACWTSLERVRNAFLCSHVSELHCTNRRVERRTADVSSVHSPSLKWSESMKHKTCAPDRVLRRRFLSARWFLCVCHLTFSEVFWTKKDPDLTMVVACQSWHSTQTEMLEVKFIHRAHLRLSSHPLWAGGKLWGDIKHELACRTVIHVAMKSVQQYTNLK